MDSVDAASEPVPDRPGNGHYAVEVLDAAESQTQSRGGSSIRIGRLRKQFFRDSQAARNRLPFEGHHCGRDNAGSNPVVIRTIRTR